MTGATTNPLIRAEDQGSAIRELLGIVSARAAKRLPEALAPFTGPVTVSVAPISERGFADWWQGDADQSDADRGGAGQCVLVPLSMGLRVLIAIDTPLAADLLTRRLGGASPRKDAPLGRAGERLVIALGEAIAGAIAASQPDFGSALNAALSDDPIGDGFARADDAVDIMRFDFTGEPGSGVDDGAIDVLFNAAALGRARRQPPRASQLWRSDLRRAVMAAPIAADVRLAAPAVPSILIARLAIGDVIPIPPPDTVRLMIGDRAIARGRIDNSGGTTAMRIDHLEQGTSDNDQDRA